MSTPDIRENPVSSASIGIGELSARTGVSARSLRYYEEQGLLFPGRTPAGHRRYSSDAAVRVLLVHRLFAAGLGSTEIAPLLPWLLGGSDGRPEGIESLRAHRRELEGRIMRLRDTAEILDEVLEEHAASCAQPTREHPAGGRAPPPPSPGQLTAGSDVDVGQLHVVA